MGTIRCAELVGRAREMEFADAALAHARSGRGSVVAFVGEAGIGKTRLCNELMAAAGRRGLHVMAGRSSLESSGVPLRGWSEALISKARGLAWPVASPDLAPYRATLGMVVPHWRESNWVAPVEASVVVGEALLRTLAYFAGDDGMLVVLDDLHWADEHTIATLCYVADHIAEIPVLICLALRTEGKGERLMAQLRRAGVAEFTLARLTPNEVSDMVGHCVPTTAPSIDLDALVNDSEGVPLVVEDLLSVESPGERPRRFADVVRARFHALPPAQQRAVQAAALLGERPDWQVVTRAVGLDTTTSAEALSSALTEGVLVSDGEQVGFRHALTRAVIASDIVPSERAALARSLAEAIRDVQAAGLDRDILAADLMVDAGAPALAVAVLDQARSRADAAGDLGGAALAAGRSFRLIRDHNLAGLLPSGLALVRSDLMIGQTAAAIELATELLTRSDGIDRTTTLQLHLLLARARIDQGEWESAEASLASARRLAEYDSVNAEIALLEAECAFGADRPGQRLAVEHQVAKAVAMAESSSPDAMLCAVYHFAGRVARQRDLNEAARSLEKALAVAERASLSVHRLKVLDELGTVEMLRDARSDRLERAYREALRVGAFGAAVSAGLNLASAYVMTGRHSRCIELAADVQAAAARLGLRNLEAACELQLGIAWAFSGNRTKAETHCSRAEQLAPDDGDLRAGVWAIAHGIDALIDDDRPRARRAFVKSRTHAPERHARILDASLGPSMLLDAIDGLVTPAGVRAAREIEVRGARWSELWLGTALAAALANEGDLAEASAELTRALVAGERYPLFGAIARRLIADTAAATSFAGPVELLRDAEAAFVELALPRAAENARGALRSLGHAAPRHRGTESVVDDDLRRAGVTARESEVLDFLRERRTNREIAERLFLSPKTVEKHVAALILKLGATNRVELAEIARRRRPV